MRKLSQLCTPFALTGLLYLGVAPTAIGCGFHPALEVQLESMYPGSFPVAVALRRAADRGVIDGDAKKFEEFVSLLDTFDPWYQVVLPMGTK